jgi:hypothetical protein
MSEYIESLVITSGSESSLSHTCTFKLQVQIARRPTSQYDLLLIRSYESRLDRRESKSELVLVTSLSVMHDSRWCEFSPSLYVSKLPPSPLGGPISCTVNRTQSSPELQIRPELSDLSLLRLHRLILWWVVHSSRFRLDHVEVSFPASRGMDLQEQNVTGYAAKEVKDRCYAPRTRNALHPSPILSWQRHGYRIINTRIM